MPYGSHRLSRTTKFSLPRVRLIKKHSRISRRINLSTTIRSNQYHNLLRDGIQQRWGTRHKRLHHIHANTRPRRYILHPRFRLLYTLMLCTNTNTNHGSHRHTKEPRRQSKRPNPQRRLTSSHRNNLYNNTNTKRQRQRLIIQHTRRPQSMLYNTKL